MSFRRIAPLVLLGIAVAGYMVFFRGQSHLLQGALLPDRDIQFALKQRADANRDHVLSAREIRSALASIIRGVIRQDSGHDINGDGSVTKNDTRDTVRGFRALLMANCGNGTVDAGEECDDTNTTDGDGCSSYCTLETNLGACTIVDENDDIAQQFPSIPHDTCDVKAGEWCPAHPDTLVYFRETETGYQFFTYCPGAVRSCNIIDEQSGGVQSGYFDTADHPRLCITKHVRNCDFRVGKPVLFDGQAIAVCGATVNTCGDMDGENRVDLPGSITTTLNSKKQFATYRNTVPPVTTATTADTCLTESPQSAQQNVNTCSGPYCYVHQFSCLGEAHDGIRSFLVKGQVNPDRFPGAPDKWQNCFSGCAYGFCNVPAGAQDADPFVSQFTCTDAQVTTGGHDITTKLAYVKNFLLGNNTDAATRCIEYAAVRYGAKAIFLQSLVSRGVARDRIDQIAAHRLLQTYWGYNLPASTNEFWNRDEAEAFLQQSDTPFTRHILSVYHQFGP